MLLIRNNEIIIFKSIKHISKNPRIYWDCIEYEAFEKTINKFGLSGNLKQMIISERFSEYIKTLKHMMLARINEIIIIAKIKTKRIGVGCNSYYVLCQKKAKFKSNSIIKGVYNICK